MRTNRTVTDLGLYASECCGAELILDAAIGLWIARSAIVLAFGNSKKKSSHRTSLSMQTTLPHDYYGVTWH